MPKRLIHKHVVTNLTQTIVTPYNLLTEQEDMMKQLKIKKIARKAGAGLLAMIIALVQLNLSGIEAKAETVYTVEASASKTEFKVGEVVNLTAVIKADGEEMSDIYEGGQSFKFWSNGANYDKASFTNDWDKDNCSVTFSEAGTYSLTASYHIESPWTDLAKDYLTITVTDADGNGDEGGTEEGYNLTFDIDNNNVEVGDTVSLSASLKNNGEAVTDLSEAGLEIWFWTDTWASGHSGGNSDAVYSNNDADGHSFNSDVTFPSVGTYYIACELKDGSGRIDIKFIEFTVSEPEYSLVVTASDENPEPGDTVSLTATLKHNGETVTDLASSGMYLYWYADKWIEGHDDGLTDVVLSDYDDNSGHSLSAKVKVQSEGKYYMVAKLQDSSWNDLKVVSILLTAEADETVVGDIDVNKVTGLDADFIMGMDISSVISEFDSGVTFKDFDGNTISNANDFVRFLASVGVNTIRVRVWNNPYDSSGHGYGGGNNDVNKAKILADACRSAGIKMLVDFHCSDLWTDPGKYKAPKEWSSYTVEEKATALKQFMIDSLNTIDSSKDVVTMVQVGNETTGGFIGESDNAKMCTLFAAGIAGVKEYNSSVQTVIHVTNPEKSNMTKWASILNNNGVDYDILATSYYPYWHGTLSNLKSQLSTVKSTYGKNVMVAETSYAYTLDDTDGHDNTVRVGNNDNASNCTEPFSVQGQATAIRNLIEAVSEAGGLGVFYWESAWITVGDTTGLTGDEYTAKVDSNKSKWEQYGSGWAASYASEYDPSDAGQWYGGSAVDNEAMFYPDGRPTAAINVWDYVKTGAETSSISVESITDAEESIVTGGTYTLPATIKVTYNKGSVNESVSWNPDDIALIDVSRSGVYEVNGTVSLSKEVNSGDYAGQTTVQAKYILTIQGANLITDTLAAGFESGSKFTVSGTGISSIPANDDPYEGSHSMHWYNAAACQGVVTYNEAIELAPGKYTFSLKAQGYTGDQVTLKILSEDEANEIKAGTPATLSGWCAWAEPTVSFSIEADTVIKLQIVVDMQNGGWGTADAMYLYRTGDLPSDNGNRPGGNNSNGETPGEGNSNKEPLNDRDVNTDNQTYSDAHNGTSVAEDNTVAESQSVGEKLVSLFVPIYVSAKGNGNQAATNAQKMTGAVNNFGTYSLRQANQGPMCVQALKNATPAGYSQVVAFDMVTGSEISSKNKNGIISFSIPEQFRKEGRSFILLGVDKTGVVKMFTNTSKDIKTFTANIDINGYSFSLIYSDDSKAIKGIDNVTIPKTIKNKVATDVNGTYLIINKGDSLSKLAKALNTTVAYLLKKNNIINPNKINVGQKIYV